MSNLSIAMPATIGAGIPHSLTYVAAAQHGDDVIEGKNIVFAATFRVKPVLARVAPRRERITVLVADTVGYSRLMELDEEDTHERLGRLRRQVYEPAIEKADGTLIKHTGDGFLAVFKDPRRGMQCAIDIQRAVTRRSAAAQQGRQVMLRIGLNLCDAIIDHDDVFGEGVNVAARLQAYAEPGDIVLTRSLSDEIELSNIGLPWFDLGELTLKNLSRAVPALNLRVGSIGKSSPAAPRRDEIRPSIAVLPFHYEKVYKRDQMLAAGIVDELVNTLGTLRQLLVISRASTRLYQSDAIDARQIGRELDVRYILHGAVHRKRDSVVINAELSDTTTGQVVSSSRFEGARHELYQLENKLAINVLRTIAPQLQENELRRIKRQPHESRTAYDLTLQAIEQLFRMDPASHARARSLLRQAISDDPEFAPARTYMAYALILSFGEGWSNDPQADATEAARMANEALERNRNDALALALFGHVHAFLFKNYEAARMYLDRAIEVGPNCANAWTLSSATHGYLGHGREALAHAEHGLRLSPLDAHLFWHESLLAQAHYVCDQFDEAFHWAQRALTQNSNMVANLRLMIATLVALGQHDRARAIGKRVIEAQPTFRLSSYAPRCPFTGDILHKWLDRLRKAELPE